MNAGALTRIGVLLPVDAVDAALGQSTLAAAVALARRLLVGLDVLAVGRDPSAAGAAAAQAGAARVLCAVHAGLNATTQGHQWTAAIEQALQAVAADAGAATRSLWLLPAHALGVEIAARLAVRQGGAALGCCDADLMLDAGGASLASAAFGGRAVVRLGAATGPWFATLRSPRVPPKAGADAPATDAVAVRTIALDAVLPAGPAVSRRPAAGRVADPAQSDVVVTGGRGMGGPEGFELLDRLAATLGGTWAGSLPAVDAGWVPVTRQVGQSGCYVSPSLYVAVGVSGTPQHMAGIAPGTRIVAINTDADADIFRYAEIGVVADWRALLPPLLDKLAAREAADAAQS